MWARLRASVRRWRQRLQLTHNLLKVSVGIGRTRTDARILDESTRRQIDREIPKLNSPDQQQTKAPLPCTEFDMFHESRDKTTDLSGLSHVRLATHFHMLAMCATQPDHHFRIHKSYHSL